MQAFKTLLIVAVLSAVAYGVYVALTGARDVEPPPGVVAEDWQGGPQIELPTTDGAQNAPPPNLTGAPAAAAPQVVQPQTATAVEAPPYTASPAAPDTSAAPPFVAPSVGPSNPGALPAGDGSASLAQPPVRDPTMAAPDVQQPPVGDGAERRRRRSAGGRGSATEWIARKHVRHRLRGGAGTVGRDAIGPGPADVVALA